MNKSLLSFFEIPAADFDRAVDFYSKVFKIDIQKIDCGDSEKMAFFPNCEGAISYSEMIKPSTNGVLISLRVESINETLEVIGQLGGKTVVGLTAIEAEGMGHFAIFIDLEGNKIGLHEQKEN